MTGLEIHAGPEFFAMLMVFARIGGILQTAPLISASAVPTPVRVVLAVLLTAVVGPGVEVDPQLVTWDAGPLGLRLVSELLLGCAMGFVATLVMSLLDIVGTFVGVNAQLAIAMQFDPLTNTQQVITTRLVQVAGFLVFLALNLHHQILLALADSFDVAPPGTGAVSVLAGMEMSGVMAAILADGLRISMPVVAAVLFLNIVAALVTRFSQQMNIYFSVGLQANAAAGLMAISLALPALAAAVLSHGEGIRALMLSMIAAVP
jgi:flagellar biosynthetic protein FliR